MVKLAARFGLPVAALEEYRALGAPMDPDKFLSWFVSHHEQKRTDHAPPRKAA